MPRPTKTSPAIAIRITQTTNFIFGIGDGDEAVLEVIEKLKRDFPQRRIRVVHVSGHTAPNDKVVKLARLVGEAQNEVLVINDSDVRVRPDYLRSVVAPLRDLRLARSLVFTFRRTNTLFSRNFNPSA